MNPAMLVGTQQGVAAQIVERLTVGQARGVIGGDREQHELGIEIVEPFWGIEGRIAVVGQ